jgi:hypothetical protein
MASLGRKRAGHDRGILRHSGARPGRSRAKAVLWPGTPARFYRCPCLGWYETAIGALGRYMSAACSL